MAWIARSVALYRPALEIKAQKEYSCAWLRAFGKE